MDKLNQKIALQLPIISSGRQMSFMIMISIDLFEELFEWELLSVVPEGSLIIMDNASFHRKSRVYEIAAQYGMDVLFLPPYIPEFSPIEKSWANLKRWLKGNFMHFTSLDFAAE